MPLPKWRAGNPQPRPSENAHGQCRARRKQRPRLASRPSFTQATHNAELGLAPVLPLVVVPARRVRGWGKVAARPARPPPSLPPPARSRRSSSPHLIVLPVFIRVHCGSGRFRRAFTASSFLTRSVLWLRRGRAGRDAGRRWRRRRARPGSGDSSSRNMVRGELNGAGRTAAAASKASVGCHSPRHGGCRNRDNNKEGLTKRSTEIIR